MHVISRERGGRRKVFSLPLSLLSGFLSPLLLFLRSSLPPRMSLSLSRRKRIPSRGESGGEARASPPPFSFARARDPSRDGNYFHHESSPFSLSFLLSLSLSLSFSSLSRELSLVLFSFFVFVSSSLSLLLLSPLIALSLFSLSRDGNNFCAQREFSPLLALSLRLFFAFEREEKTGKRGEIVFLFCRFSWSN